MLELRNVTKKYFDDKNECVTALDDVSLSLPKTGLVIINGTSGCGKTTLLNILGGLDRPTSGEVWLDNARIDNENEKWWDSFRGSCLGFIYQDFNLLENMSVKENLYLPLALQNLDEKTRQERINKIIEDLGINEYLNKKTGKLSGGQKQRVAIARALVTGSKIILADEPTGNLDRENSENVFKILKKIAKDRLVIVVTHDSVLANEYADRLIQIAYGTIESDVILEDNINKNDDVTEEKLSFLSENSATEVGERKLSLKECFGFAKEAMRQRKTRCFVSVMIFSITMLFILVLCEAVFRNDSVPITEHINDSNQTVVPLYVRVPDEYGSITGDEEISTGRKLYDLVCQNTDEGRIIRVGGTYDIEFETGISEYAEGIYVSAENEKYFTYEGKFPKEKNEIAISKTYAEKLENTDSILGSGVLLEGEEYTVTAIVNQVCGKDIKDSFLDDGSYGNLFEENLIFLSTEDLANRNRSTKVYMSGFGVTQFSNLFYQTTVYNDICSVDSEIELLAGRMPESDNEILISQYFLDLREQTDKDYVGKVYKLNDIYDSKYGCAYWNMLNLYDYIGESITIVGVAKGSGDYFVTASLYDKIFEEVEMYYENCYCLLVDENTVEDDIHALLKSDVKINDSKLQRVYEFMEGIDAIKFIMVAVVAVIALLTVLQMISLYSYSINDNKKTIGILRTIGVGKSDTYKIFTVECMVVSVISFAIAIVINVFVTYGINILISKEVIELAGFSFLRMRLVVVLLTGIINCVLSLISVLIPLRKFSKVKIIELIK